jgi:prolyl 4-hydroxylase
MGEESLSKQAARAAYGWGRGQDWGEALALLAEAAKASEPGAEAQLALVTQAEMGELLRPPMPEPLSSVARIGAVRGFAPPGFSEWLIGRAEGRLDEAAANDAGGTAVRTARVAAFGPQERDLVLAIMQQRAARLIGADVALHEPPNVISYLPGQEYRMHADFIEPSVPEFQAELAALGQRSATIVTYLNEDFDGAETSFPDAGVKFRGATGDAIVFANLRPDGSPDYNTGHCALPPTRGRKWVLSQWIRTRPFPYSAEALG